MDGRIARRSVLLGLPLAACAPPLLAAPAQIAVTHIKTITTAEAWVMQRLAGIEGLRVTRQIDCWRVLYPTTDAAGAPIRASGLLALPRGPMRALVSFQHGTTTTRANTPSKPDGTGLGAAVAFAGRGDALIAPDYIGLGASRGVHPYLVADMAARAIVDMIDAVRLVERVPRGPVFLSGFSQGGHASMAALRALEARGETVLGAAPVAGPFDLRGVSFPAALVGGAESHPLYLAYMSWGYAARYNERLDTALTPHYAALAQTLFGEPHTPNQIISALPRAPREMFTRAFLEAHDASGDHWLLTRLAENNVVNFAPRAPVRMHYGSADIDVIPAEAIEGARKLRELGAGDVQAIDVGPVGHDPSMLAAVPHIAAWLDQIAGAA